MIRSNEENIVVLLAGLINLTNGLVRSSNTLDSGIVDAGVTNHVGRGKVVHNELELVLADTLGHFLTHIRSTHLRFEVVRGDLGRGDHIPDLTGELLLDTTIEEEGNVGVFLGLSNVTLLDILLSEPLSEHVTHVLGREGDREGVVGLILGHGGEVDVLGIGEVGLRGAVVVTQELGDFTDTVGPVVEEEEGVIIWRTTVSTHIPNGSQ